MPEAVYDAHVNIGIAAEDEQRPTAPPGLRPVLLGLNIRRSLGLGEYPLGKFAELLDGLEAYVEAWVEENPPS